MEIQMDVIANGQATGAVANQLLARGLDVNAKRPFIEYNPKTGQFETFINVCKGDPKIEANWGVVPFQANNGVLRREEWMALDKVVMEVSRNRLMGFGDLESRGLVYNLGNGFATTVLEWHDINDFGEATMTMDGITRHRNDRPTYQHNYLPIPIVHMDWEINARALAMSRNLGNGIDVTDAERASRRVAEYLESMLFTDFKYSFGPKDDRNRNSIYSYINHPDRNIMALGTAWDAAVYENRGKAIVSLINKAKQKAMNALHYGPYMVYIPTAYETVLGEDYDPTYSGGITIRERIMKLNNIIDIKVSDMLPANNVLLVQLTSDVVRLVKGMPMQNVQWTSEGGMVTNYKVMTIQVPQIRSDHNGKSGIVHLS